VVNTIIIIAFCLGYAAIIFEHSLKINKSAFALFTGVFLWLLLSTQFSDHHQFTHLLESNFSETAGILFFLLGAMTTVEIIDGHKGFDVITTQLLKFNLKKLFWLIGIITFILSAILDNLTTTILMVSLTSKIISNPKLRWYIAGLIVIASNAGGAFSPIGDVTSTMLWIGGQITASTLIKSLLLPSIVCYLVPSAILYFVINKNSLFNEVKSEEEIGLKPPKSSLLVLIVGISILLAVPVFKSVFHMPPFMGMLLGLSLIWIITEIIAKRRREIEERFSVSDALSKIDTPSILFFMGILLSVGALQTAGILTDLSGYLSQHITNNNVLLFITGVFSSVVDNVPLVAAFQGMYPLSQYATDHFFWQVLCYATGTGGSILIIGSAAGVVAMGIEKISFGWYFKKISLLAFLGFAAGYFVLIALG
jgi:Na+/H+ antiporter NhaD/arsenite permease-like protein